MNSIREDRLSCSMASGAHPLQFVLSSSVRSDVLVAVADGHRTTDVLLEALDASSSAIYNALGRLEEGGLLTADRDEWHLTGSGRIVADVVLERDRLGALLAQHGEYFQRHDASVLPADHRCRMGELAGGEVIRASSAEPQAVVRAVSRRLEQSESALVVSHIYDELFESAMPDAGRSRLVVDHDVVDAVRADLGEEDVLENRVDGERARIRVAEVDFAVTVTDSAMLLSLPLPDGGYDVRSEFVAEHDRARRWGTNLFEAVWAEATPLQAFVDAEYR